MESYWFILKVLWVLSIHYNQVYQFQYAERFEAAPGYMVVQYLEMVYARCCCTTNIALAVWFSFIFYF